MIIFDEVAYMDKETWDTVRPILSDNLGKSLMITTPNGVNWFYDLFENAKRRDDWAVFHYPTELKGILDVCYKILAQIYGFGNPQVQVTNVEYPQINFKWDWEQDGDQDY